ncbi:ion channel [Deinococcus koreensis]|uniref:Transporter n=1 Tax=Deinococcus koreensis TaxID=2054903 RepID=A0A2K3UVM8_9DEIO|nr:ion channel [Deinococcus koreensis]PNY80588.1 transporter [Deinococcus koreensis]
MTHSAPTSTPPQADDQPLRPPGDLGLSGVFEGETRFLNRDGRFNSRRIGLGLGAYNPYTLLLAIGWTPFFGWALTLYLLLNALFGLGFFALGPGALSEMPGSTGARLLACFFFSVQTFGTIGFGHVYPVTLAANALVTIEAFVGLMGVALVTGMLFARFSRPTHRLLFSDGAVVAPYRGGRGLMVRLANGRRSELMDVTAEIVLSLRPPGHRPDDPHREFHSLALERSRVTFFPLAWTIVHPMDSGSPLAGLDEAELREREAELLVVLRATDETSQQPIQARISYHATEIRWGRAFASMYLRDGGRLAVDVRRLHDTQPAELPPGA